LSALPSLVIVVTVVVPLLRGYGRNRKSSEGNHPLQDNEPQQRHATMLRIFESFYQSLIPVSEPLFDGYCFSALIDSGNFQKADIEFVELHRCCRQLSPHAYFDANSFYLLRNHEYQIATARN